MSEPLGTHPYMKDLVERRMADVDLPANANVATVIIAHGNGSGRFAHEELRICESIDSNKPVYARHYMV